MMAPAATMVQRATVAAVTLAGALALSGCGGGGGSGTGGSGGQPSGGSGAGTEQTERTGRAGAAAPTPWTGPGRRLHGPGEWMGVSGTFPCPGTSTSRNGRPTGDDWTFRPGDPGERVARADAVSGSSTPRRWRAPRSRRTAPSAHRTVRRHRAACHLPASVRGRR